MGSTFSSPQPPLIALQGGSLGKHNNILVPADAFAPKPNRFGRYHRNKYYAGPPMYRRAGDVFEDCVFYPGPAPMPVRERVAVPRRRARGRREEEARGRNWGRRRGGGGGGVNMGPGMGMGMGTGMVYPQMGGAPMGMGGNVPMMPVYYDPRGVKAMSVPNLHMGMGQVPPRVGKGVKPMMQQPVMMQGQVPGAPGVAYPQPQGGAPQWQVPGQAQMPPRPPRAQVQKQRGTPGVDDIAYGAHVARGEPTLKAGRRAPEPPVSKHLNRAQPSNRKVGPSGHEWLDGENAWLDACTCTTNCQCRKGARVLYRAQDGDDEGQKRQGEIRYIVKDDLGKDCGDHTKCRLQDDENDSSDGRRGKTRKKSKRKGRESTSDVNSDVGKMREEMAGLRTDLANMKLGMTPRGAGMNPGMGPPQTAQFGGGFGQPGGVPPQTGFLDTVNAVDPRMGPRIDPHMAHIGDGEPFGTLPSPSMQPRPNGKTMRKYGHMPRMGMPGLMGVNGMGFDNDMDFPNFEEEIMDPMNPMPHLPPPMAKIRGGRQRPGRGRGGKPGGPMRRRQFDFDPRTEYPLPMRGGNMKAPPMRREPRRNRPPPDYNLDGGDDSGLDGEPPQRFGGLDDDEDDWVLTGDHPSMEGRPDMAPPRRSPPRGRGGSSLESRPIAEDARRPKQARVDEDLEDY